VTAFRPATIADVPALHALIERAYRGESATRGWTHEAHLLGGQRTDPQAMIAQFSSPDEMMILAEREGTPIGCVGLTGKSGGCVYLGLLTVDPDLQAAGLGRALLAEAERAAVVRFAASRIEMTVIVQRAELIAWYERRGYALTGERRPFPYGNERVGMPTTDALEFVVLEKRLS
jgi:N-acetylglutamate synthase-like GNAT family acetyltransferase